MASAINLDELPRDREPYLGWYLETTPQPLRTYICYAWEDEGEGAFRVSVNVRGVVSEHREQFDQSRELSLGVARGKVFLGTWRHDEQYDVKLPYQRNVSTPLIRQLILRGLHRLYEGGFNADDFRIDLQGVALELGVKVELVHRAVEFLYQNSLIEDYGTMGRNWKTGDFSLSHKGAEYVESQGLAVEMFLQELYRSTLTRLFAQSVDLAQSLENLRESAASPSGSRQELVGFSSMVRDFVQGLTDHLYQRIEPVETLPREETINKVKRITEAAKSETRRDHVRALAEVVETHWRRLNKVQQKAVHEGTVEKQRLFTYVLLFVADLLDVVEGK